MIHRGNTDWYTKPEALEKIAEAIAEGNNILGIDGAYITQQHTQPSIENSIDFSSSGIGRGNAEHYGKAIAFLQKQPDDLLFDLVFDTD